MRRWGIAAAVGCIALGAAIIWLVLVFKRSPPSLPAGSITSLDVSLQATPNGQAASKIMTADGAKIEALATVLRRGRPVEDHKCGETGSLSFHLKDGSDIKLELLSGHDRRYCEFRAYSGSDYDIFRIDRPAFQQAMSGLGAGLLDPGLAE